MTEISKEENEIFTRWKLHYDNLGIDLEQMSYDGKIVPEKYNQDKGILFVLKETHSYGGKSLQNLLKDGPVHQMWHSLSRWAAGLLNDFPEYKNINNWKMKKESIQQIAAINLKKITGGVTANMSIVSAYAHQDRKLLLDQIAIIKPKVIIACGTYTELIWLLDLKVDLSNSNLEPIYSNTIKATVIPWVHPGRVKNSSTYDKLRDLFSEHKDKFR